MWILINESFFRIAPSSDHKQQLNIVKTLPELWRDVLKLHLFEILWKNMKGWMWQIFSDQFTQFQQKAKIGAPKKVVLKLSCKNIWL